MYSRKYRERALRFEPSGGLLNGSLVLQDKETDSYWSIITGTAIAGELAGSPLRKLHVSRTMPWQEWLHAHPETEVLSINGREDGRDPYKRYYRSSEGYRGLFAKDDRLRTKTEVFGFTHNGEPYAVEHRLIHGGRSLRLEGTAYFFFRPPNARLLTPTSAYISDRGPFSHRSKTWRHAASECTFDTAAAQFSGGEVGACPEQLAGVDTFWYIWSLTHPTTRLLEMK